MRYAGAKVGEGAGDFAFVLLHAAVDDLMVPVARAWGVRVCGMAPDEVVGQVLRVAVTEGVDVSLYRPALYYKTCRPPYRWLEFDGDTYTYAYSGALPDPFIVRLDDYQLRGGVYFGHVVLPDVPVAAALP